jgi:putative transferase (TIGR04331 family)
MVRRFLITTSLQESWRDNEPVLFLGEWCRRFSASDRLSRMDSETLPYHWDDRARLHADYRQLSELHERLLADLAGDLNRLHGVNHGLRYWRILVGPWLGYFVQVLFDRWTSIREASARFELSGTCVLDGEDAAPIPNDMGEFVELIVDDWWNHHLYGALLRNAGVVPITQGRTPASVVARTAAPRHGVLSALKSLLTRAHAKTAAMLSRDDDAFLLGTYLSARDEWRLCRRLRQPFVRRRGVAATVVAADPAKRAWTVSGENRTEFESCARAFIPAQIPRAYLEGYAALVDQVKELPWPRTPKAIWTSSAQGADEVFKCWAADKIEHGVPLVIGQHGGHFGVGRWSFVEDHDVAISDRYLTWGWSDPERGNLRGLGQFRLAEVVSRNAALQTALLLVMGSMPRFSYWMFSACVAGQWLEYFDDQCEFVAQLPEKLRAALIVRLYPRDFGWDQQQRWQQRFPQVRLDTRTDMDALIRSSRIYISTYNATTYLESLSRDVPTVIYWRPDHWELRDSAQPYFDELEAVGIFHASPKSAAQHVTAVWDDVDRWWSSKAVRSAVHRFRSRYCRPLPDLAGTLAASLQEAAIAPMRQPLQ